MGKKKKIIEFEQQLLEKEEDIKELGEYREKLETEIIEREKDYHNSITYIAAGALAFFLTINDKFFHITEAHYKGLLFISLSSLLISIVLFLIISIEEIKTDKVLRDKADEMIVNAEYDDILLTGIWKKRAYITRIIYYSRFGCLIFGILMEVIFVSLNALPAKTANVNSNTAINKIDIVSHGDTIHIDMDTVNKKLSLILNN